MPRHGVRGIASFTKDMGELQSRRVAARRTARWRLVCSDTACQAATTNSWEAARIKGRPSRPPAGTRLRRRTVASAAPWIAR